MVLYPTGSEIPRVKNCNFNLLLGKRLVTTEKTFHFMKAVISRYFSEGIWKLEKQAYDGTRLSGTPVNSFKKMSVMKTSYP